MVAAVAVVRLILGTIIGLGAGWFNSRLGRFLDLLISAALSVPVLIVALGAIAMLGAELGLIAFIIGLSINGWGETARFVREQTKIIKGQVYIESAHALGASPFQMLTQHVLRQVMPMVWMLFAFEISGTLMVTAGLGFLGYFIGGDVWVEVADFVSRRISGTPELGQMLATSWVSLLEPWPLVLTGSVIFITILGFNLLGDGLRIRLNPEYINRNSPIALLNHRFSMWFEQSVSYPVSTWLKANRLRPVMVMVAIVALVSIYYHTRTNASLTASHINLSAPGGQLWASEKINPYGTSYTDAPGLVEPQKLWEINQPAGFSGNPVISSDGTIYVAGLNATLVALNPDGSVIHTTGLPEIPMGPLAMGPEGNIYVTDAKGGLSALSSAGALLWTFNAVEFGKPNHGAIVAPDGTIYYLLEDPRGDTIFALFPDGQLKWSLKTGTRLVNTPLRLTPNAKEIFIKNVVVNVADGSLVELTLPTQGSAGRSGQDQLFVGSNGKTYLLAGHVVIEWKHTSQGFTRVNSAEWDYRDIGFYQVNAFPVDAAVIKPDKILLLYAGEFGATRVVWLDPTGKVLGTIRGPFYEDTHIVAIQGDGIITICGVGGTDRGAMTAMCSAYQADQDQPIWTYILGVELNGIVGAAMAPGRLYVITGNGTLTALGDVINSLSNPAPRP
jgi:ABC-type dipeptide/oligopeptide/nickel transport system permease subunit/outer membrane protein assembly factor BamB